MPPEMGPQVPQAALVDLALESWRFLQATERMTHSLDADQRRRALSKLAYFQKRIIETLESSELKLIVLDGSPFGPGLAASALNAGEFLPGDEVIVDQTIEPIVMGADGVVRPGTVTLRRG